MVCFRLIAVIKADHETSVLCKSLNDATFALTLELEQINSAFSFLEVYYVTEWAAFVGALAQ